MSAARAAPYIYCVVLPILVKLLERRSGREEQTRSFFRLGADVPRRYDGDAVRDAKVHQRGFGGADGSRVAVDFGDRFAHGLSEDGMRNRARLDVDKLRRYSVVSTWTGERSGRRTLERH